VLFSSTTALWGAQGLAHYAAANQLLDGLAHLRGAMGLPALSVNWGTWAAMRLASDEARQLYSTAGLEPMSAPGALAMLDAMLGTLARQITIAAVDWDRLKPIYEARRARPFFSEVGAIVSERRPKERETSMAETWNFENVPDTERKEVLGERVRIEVATVLGLGDAAEVDPARGLFDLGMDSLMAVELRARLQKRAGCALPSTLTFNYPNAAALTQFLERLLFVMPANNVINTAAALSAGLNATQPASAVSAADGEELSEDELEQLLAERLRTL
jgi:acyl carrier protein